MTRRVFAFEPPDRFVAGAVGEPGQRTFFLQARKGGAIVSVGLEKIQVAVLAERLGALLDEVKRQGADVSTEVPLGSDDVAPLDDPVVELFRVGAMALTWDDEHESVVIEAQAETGPNDEVAVVIDEDQETGPDLLRVRITATDAVAFVERATRVIAAGRPPCPLCGQPLNPEGHICPRRNGYLH